MKLASKTHVGMVLAKCGLRKKGELREFFADWDPEV